MMADMRRHCDMTHWCEYTDNPIACVYLGQGVCSMDGYEKCLGWAIRLAAIASVATRSCRGRGRRLDDCSSEVVTRDQWRIRRLNRSRT
jgi:hypothetical protein